MGFLDLFKHKEPTAKHTQWEELGAYNASFTAFGSDLFRSSTVRSCIRPLAEFSAKAEARCSDKQVERMLNYRPNIYMSGHDFLMKVRTNLELMNTAAILIMRDDRGKLSGLYPIPYSRFTALEYSGRLFVQFEFRNASAKPLTVPWEDLAMVRKDYNRSDIVGDENYPILDDLNLIAITNQGIENAVKSTANLRGILKSTKAMLAPEAIKQQKEDFVKDYLNLENEGGVASLDATQEFIPITMSPKTVDADQQKEFRENVYRYFGVNDDIITGNMDSSKIEAFYEIKIEPFLVALSRELTAKVYQGKALAFDNWIVYEANKLQFASLDKKISMFKEVVLYGGMTINEWRLGCNMSPIEGGDTPIRRLDAAEIQQEGEENEG